MQNGTAHTVLSLQQHPVNTIPLSYKDPATPAGPGIFYDKSYIRQQISFLLLWIANMLCVIFCWSASDISRNRQPYS